MSLPRESKIPSEPRFNYVTDKAYAFLVEQGYNRFPISPFKVVEDLSEYITCLPWSDARRILKSEDPFHLNKTGAEARTIRMRDSGLYYIVYDDVNVNNDARISWTIMHEIGHIILGHLTDFGETALDRGGLTDEKYGVLEKEAHYFAAEFLMPTALLKFFPGITVDEISLLFGVSEEAATRKYKRVFQTSYLPSSNYDRRLIRNFYDFLMSDVDETIYRNIYNQWGLPNHARYVSICRKCPSCFTYINDSAAEYCPYCGSLIEQKRTYKKMFERLDAQQKFAKLPGYSHPALPYEYESNGKVRKVRFCLQCLNSSFGSDARYCMICGQPLYGYCTVCRTPLKQNECYCTSCGTESAFNVTYKRAEERINKIKELPSQFRMKDWMPYPYWGYIRMRFMGEIGYFGEDFKSALLYSNAYVEDDKIIVLTDSIPAAASIADHRPILLDMLRKFDKYEYQELEVYTTNDLQ